MNWIKSSRWSKGTWTFDGNLVEFSPDNAVVKAGMLFLAIRTENGTGFSGQPPIRRRPSAAAGGAPRCQEFPFFKGFPEHFTAAIVFGQQCAPVPAN